MAMSKLTSEKKIAFERASKRAALLSLIGILIVISSIVYSAYKLGSLRKEIRELEGRKEELISQNAQLETNVTDLGSQLKVVNKELANGVDDVSFTVEQINRILESTQGETRKDALRTAFTLYKQNTPRINFKWGGKSPQEGFDASGYIAYVLSQVGVIKNPESHYSGLLFQKATKETGDKKNLEAGDLIYFDPSQVVFYINNELCLGIFPEGGILVTHKCSGSNFTRYGKVTYK